MTRRAQVSSYPFKKNMVTDSFQHEGRRVTRTRRGIWLYSSRSSLRRVIRMALAMDLSDFFKRVAIPCYSRYGLLFSHQHKDEGR